MANKRALQNQSMREELEAACSYWGNQVQKALDERFGKDRAGFMLILTTSGEGGTMHLKTSLKLSGAIAFLRELADKVSQGMSGIIRP